MTAPRSGEHGTVTQCPIEGVHEHAFRGPHGFREWLGAAAPRSGEVEALRRALHDYVGDHDMHPAHMPDCSTCVALNGPTKGGWAAAPRSGEGLRDQLLALLGPSHPHDEGRECGTCKAYNLLAVSPPEVLTPEMEVRAGVE